jgi:hypothetical protein
MMLHADRFHRPAQIGEIALDAQGSPPRRFAKPERLGKPPERPGVPVNGAGRAVAGAPGEKKGPQGTVKVRFGVSRCCVRYFRGVLNARNALFY